VPQIEFGQLQPNQLADVALAFYRPVMSEIDATT